MQRTLFESEHDAFREMVRSFLDRSVAGRHEQWEKAGLVDRDVWVEAGKQGMLGMDVPEEYGGGGVADFRYNAVLDEEIIRIGATGLGFGLHNDIVGPYLLSLTTQEQKRRWLPGFCAGEIITAIAMSEPGAGSDLQRIRTHAGKDGDDWVLSGSKTFITNGINADLVLVVARTDPDAEGARGISLLAVERGMPGFERGRNLDKIGMKAQDTAELFFDEVRVPAENLVGQENRGFVHLMENLPQERLSIAVVAVAACEAVLADAGLREAAAGVRAPDRLVPELAVRHGRADHADDGGPDVRGRVRAGPPARRADRAGRGDGEVVDDRPAEQGRRRLPAAARRVRLHERVPGLQGLARRPGPVHLRRHQRDHEGDRRPRSRPLSASVDSSALR
jgi:hypothetical protein